MPAHKEVKPNTRRRRSQFPRLVLALIILASHASATFAQSPSEIQEPERQGFEGRAQTLLAYFVEKETRPSFAAVAARYAAGERISEAHRMMTDLLAVRDNDVSYTFRMLATYLYGRQNLPPGLAEKVKDNFGGIAVYRGGSEHETVLYHASLLLAAETWPDMRAEQWFNGKSSAENLREAQIYLAEWLELLVTRGQTEFDAPQHMPSFFAALALMHEFTRDEALRKKLHIALHVVMIDFAAEHMSGMYTGAHSTLAQKYALSPKEAPSNGFAWLYFGVGRMIPSAELLFASLSSYEMPAVITQLATRRDPLGGYVHREQKRRPPAVRHEDGGSSGFCKYTYVTRHYTLGSVPGGALSPKEQSSWSLTYRSKPDDHPVLFIVAPNFTARELGRFHAAEPRLLLAEMDARRREAAQDNLFRGAAEYERLFQHRNVLIGLYDAPDSLARVRLHGFFSAGLDTLVYEQTASPSQKPDWIFGKAADTFFALLPLQPYRLEGLAEGRLFISEGRRNGFILEVSTATESVSLEEFQRRIRAVTQTDLSAFMLQNKVKYTTIYGDKMEFAFDAATGKVMRFLNNIPVVESDCALFDNVMLKHDANTRRMVLRFKNEWLEMDFKKWEMTEHISTITEELKQQ